MTNEHNNVLYTGVTNNLQRRVLEHRTGRGSAFTSRYKIWKFVYYEVTGYIEAALFREKETKAGSRKKKIDFVNSINPEWNDLYTELFS